MYTGFDPAARGEVLRGQRNGSRISVACPAACVSYNKYMGGVDRGDQLRGYYHVRMKCRKFYKYVANFMLDVAITNSLTLFRCRPLTSKSVTTKTFRELLAKELVGDYCSKRRPGRGPSRAPPSLSLQHFPTKHTTNQGGSKRGRCALCRERHKRIDTTWRCTECGVWHCHQGTIEDCFLQWHRRQN